jgi:hypothetical protein
MKAPGFAIRIGVFNPPSGHSLQAPVSPRWPQNKPTGCSFAGRAKGALLSTPTELRPTKACLGQVELLGKARHSTHWKDSRGAILRCDSSSSSKPSIFDTKRAISTVRQNSKPLRSGWYGRQRSQCSVILGVMPVSSRRLTLPLDLLPEMSSVVERHIKDQGSPPAVLRHSLETADAGPGWTAHPRIPASACYVSHSTRLVVPVDLVPRLQILHFTRRIGGRRQLAIVVQPRRITAQYLDPSLRRQMR